ncbi:zinc phosphodiesterase ELAC protein 1 [Scleropages formosus]|uniref:ElaC ribonuclease Z 1 n=2 Tax=Scleropages formosus TaxID=113540 RepID=A0A8C9V7E8_SCLFO|nr:zinc phosphodiesterase ELAC protein 1 [Scleropages formosus]XP_018613822.2 zinc phosphodiesterase ELAC protein 1 [Scleropages formosus]
MAMDVTFLGSGSAYPSPHRGASALVLRNEGDCWLFDCGEGTQTQLMKSQLKASRITKVFISHLHGDHLFGLPGLLCTVSLSFPPLQSQPSVLPESHTQSHSSVHVDIYGPRGLRQFLRVALGLSASQLLFRYAVHELEPTADQCPPEGQIGFMTAPPTDDHLHPQEVLGRTISLCQADGCYTLLEDERVVVKAFRLFHRLPSFGFSVQERERPGRLKTQLLKQLGLKPGPDYGRLKNGGSVTLEDGRVVTSKEVLEEPVCGRKVCILGDCSALVGEEDALRVCRGADLLIHEATLSDEQQERAVEHGHSTPSMAAALARACQAHKLVLNHFSQRYKPVSQCKEGEEENVLDLKKQAEEALEGTNVEVLLAEDFLTLTIPIKRLTK